MHTEDGNIIRKCLEGDKSAFNYLVDKYKGSVYAHAYSRLQNFHDAEDVAQDVFINAYRKLYTLRQWDSFVSWLYSITNNLCKLRIRSQSRQPDSEFIEDQDPDIINRSSLDQYQEASMFKSINEALNSLPETHREILTLHYLGGMKILDMAVYLGLSSRTIARRLNDARSSLKKEFLAIMNTRFEKQKLSAAFTIRISEMIKGISLNPITPKALPWGASITAGIILTIMSFSHNLIPPDYAGTPVYSPLSGKSKVLESGEIPVDVIDISKKPFISSQIGSGDGGVPQKPFIQNKALSQRGIGKWTRKGDMPTRRAVASAGVAGGKIYIFGGVDKGRTLTTVEEYDPITGRWSRKANMPNIRYSLSVSEVNGKIYVIGGWRSEDGMSFTMVEEYNPETNRWTRKADMPTSRSALSTSVVNGKIYAIGGDGGDYLPAPTLSAVEEYDPLTDIWTKKADMPTTRGGLCTASVNGKIYAIGGVRA